MLLPAICFLGLSFTTMLVLAAIGLVLWRAWKSYKDFKDGQAARETLAEVLGIFSGQLRAGNTTLVVEEHEDLHLETVQVLEAASRRAAAGGNVEDSLGEAKVHRRVDDELRRLGVMWGASRRYGIGLATVIDHQREVLDAYAKHQRSHRAQAQGAMMSARVLLVLPLAGIGLGSAMGAEPLDFLLGGGIGGVVLGVGVALAGLGYWWSQRIIGKAMP
ncbi:MAG: hypothetical protein Q3962_08110 [Corynebacterium sp.]|nr:hypothetical protein [Corynebacterium sp.]